MKKYPFFLIALCLLAAPAFAQKGSAAARRARAARKGNNTFYHNDVTKILEQRAENARLRLLATQRAFFPNVKLDFPYISGVRGINAQTTELLKMPSYIRSRKQVAFYLTAQENRLYRQKIKQLNEMIWPQLDKHITRLKYIANHPPKTSDPLAFLANQLPKQINTIAIGDVHDLGPTRTFDNIKKLTARFLSLIRQTHPEQEIFLFTEFMEQDKEYEPANVRVLHPYHNVFEAARKNNIQIVGLEGPESIGIDCVMDRIKLEYSDGDNVPFDFSLSGMKRRNEIFAQIIQAYRAKHPNALFILYTGNLHIFYTRLFSLTTNLDPKKTFVLSVLPTKRQVKKFCPHTYLQQDRYMWDPLGDLIQSDYYFSQPFLYWKDLSRIVGADAFIHAEDRFIYPNEPTEQKK